MDSQLYQIVDSKLYSDGISLSTWIWYGVSMQ